MTGDDFNRLFGAVISPAARISVSEAWPPAVHDAMSAIRDLPTDVRAFLIVKGIREADGHLVFDIAAAPEYMPESGMARLTEIIETAQAAVKRSVH
ncbi:hypothetical protein [Sinorhizobium fredii]|uniref:hypothetical protein n=1 Tax=Rhizobium fredii TaxID=380 RepID=UPI0004B0A8CF|nr:hypothetical protein [Sinorhizobium fredii]AWM24094.1 hypothetical protein AOX55_0000817 [Sinorhizobium fredii CCBAU 25509]